MIGLSSATASDCRLSSTRLNSADTDAVWPNTPERQIVGVKRRSMNRSDIRMREYLCRRLSAARRRQKYEPGYRETGMWRHCLRPKKVAFRSFRVRKSASNVYMKDLQMCAYCPDSRHVPYFIIHCQRLKLNVDFRGKSVQWSQTPSPSVRCACTLS